MPERFIEPVRRELSTTEAAGTWKRERVISTPQGVRVRDGEPERAEHA